MATSHASEDRINGSQPQTRCQDIGRQQANVADTASRTPNNTHEPRAIRDWKWIEYRIGNSRPELETPGPELETEGPELETPRPELETSPNPGYVLHGGFD